MDAATIDLPSAAERLGVHYQTAYKWVRAGSLPAQRVGAAYALRIDDVDAFHRRRSNPAPRRTRTPRQGFGPVSQRCYEMLSNGDENGLRSSIGELARDGVTFTTMLQELIVPSLRMIGDDWHRGDASIATEHRASAIVERIIGEHHPNPRGRRRGIAIVFAPAGDRHGLPTAMAAAALRENNWTVHHLGADLPPEEAIRFCDETAVDLVVVTATTEAGLEASRSLEAQFHTRSERVLLGTPGATLDELQRRAREAQ